MSPYENLANAIVIQAAQDYLTETKVLKKLLSQEPSPDPPKPPEQDGDDKERKEKDIHEKWEDKCNKHRFNLASIEQFFHSQWYQMLTDADGDAIFQKLKQEADKDMTAKEYLSQAYRLDQRINSDIVELGRLRLMSQNISSPGFEEHYNATRNTDAPFIKQVEKIMELEKTINEEIDRLVDLKAQIRLTIDSVKNTDERMVLRYCYVDHMTWEQIGDELRADSRTVRRWHENALTHVVMPENPIQI